MLISSSSKHPLLAFSPPSLPTIRPQAPTFLSLTPLKSPTHEAILSFRPLYLRPSTCINPKFSLYQYQPGRRALFRTWFSSFDGQDPEEGPPRGMVEKRGNDWSTSVLLFGLWAGLMFYVFRLTPDQTPVRDMYFLQKLLNLKGDDGFQMNGVLVALWYIMGLWPLVYSMLLEPSGRSSRSSIPVWPFLVLSFFGGAYALIPYFVLWRPPPPAVDEDEISRWPLNFLESKFTAGITLAAGLGIVAYAILANGDAWTEFYQYFRESKFIHVTCLDFSLLTAFSPFWVYNDMTARKWIDKGSWLLPVALIPFIGPALYLLFRPPLSKLLVSVSPPAPEKD